MENRELRQYCFFDLNHNEVSYVTDKGDLVNKTCDQDTSTLLTKLELEGWERLK